MRKLPHLQRETSRGRVFWYVRVDRGLRVRIRAIPGTKEFFADYQAALVSVAPAAAEKDEKKRASIGWLIAEFLKSGHWLKLAAETRKQLSYQLKRVDEASGKNTFAAVTRAHIEEGMDRRRKTPTDANKFLKAMRKLFSFAVARGHVRHNPTDGIAKLKLPNREIGFHTWTEDEIAQYEAYWPVGTRERLALDIMLYTGFRRGDAVKLGRQHIRDGIITFRASKNGEEVIIPLLPPLAQSIKATKTGDLTLLVTNYGRPFAKAGFGNWFKASCLEAGVPGSCHGLRKAGAVRAAEGGATEAELNALFGWRDGSRESATYTRRARRSKMAKRSGKLLVMPKSSLAPARTLPSTPKR